MPGSYPRRFPADPTGRGKESQLRAQIRRPPPWWAGHLPGPRLATAAVVPVVPIIDGGKLVPTCRVVPAVPIIDLAAVVPYAGKLVPVVPCPSSGATPWQAGADHRPCQRRARRRIERPQPTPGQLFPAAGKVVPVSMNQLSCGIGRSADTGGA